MADLEIAEIPYPSGNIKFRYSRYPSEDGSKWIRHGLFRAYHEDGTLSSEGIYEHGSENGIWHDYHPNGTLAAQGSYENGIQVGVWQYWNEDGSLSI
ncbi:MAG: hypothetical protein B7Y56_09870 [Gallionellales bacterium 35-53-114]|jgi:antitoxin component YwqK of YwqJK toxin-antitoxin module|nr:MAG: hypothetical protein B7Y56_09870 [Gallionellales bacterium 35-53-114]OYZ62413.1 MAG: hypothetical protein B7Y04_13725 [Gallionellales bacterium 24-53-125]OZB08475.1 MAG: hypothetical protein B7X61_09935 [Gallionellales bacterium 39-52-133]HQS59437.1 hypothetical protein [Gallionellaceae bacterium]HQS76350.1 hypothetical protein [Gallionellaceae bacterium]